MAVTRNSQSVQMTAVNDSYPFQMPVRVVGINFQGTGLTSPQRVVIRDTATPGTGNLLADYQTEGTTLDNGDLWGAKPPQRVSGVSIDNSAVAGTWVVTITIQE